MIEKDIMILLVDDDPVDREMIRRSLDDLSIEFDEASSCKEFLSFINTNKSYDLIILDYKLPDDTGLNAAKQVQTLGVTTPIIIVTGFGSEELERQSAAAGLLGYIAKDKVTPAVIVKVILSAFVEYKRKFDQLKQNEREAIDRINHINAILQTKAATYK